MKRPLHLFDQLSDIIQGKPGPEISQIARYDGEGLPLGRDAAARESGAQRLVDDLLEGPADAARFGLELDGHVVIEGEGSPHLRFASAKAS